ncbi:hypothetical protein HDU96_004246, partial [Phlyctochytrium bullatum]
MSPNVAEASSSTLAPKGDPTDSESDRYVVTLGTPPPTASTSCKLSISGNALSRSLSSEGNACSALSIEPPAVPTRSTVPLVAPPTVTIVPVAPPATAPVAAPASIKAHVDPPAFTVAPVDPPASTIAPVAPPASIVPPAGPSAATLAPAAPPPLAIALAPQAPALPSLEAMHTSAWEVVNRIAFTTIESFHGCPELVKLNRALVNNAEVAFGPPGSNNPYFNFNNGLLEKVYTPDGGTTSILLGGALEVLASRGLANFRDFDFGPDSTVLHRTKWPAKRGARGEGALLVPLAPVDRLELGDLQPSEVLDSYQLPTGTHFQPVYDARNVRTPPKAFFRPSQRHTLPLLSWDESFEFKSGDLVLVGVSFLV